MAQILDTQVASGGAFILDTQESGAPAAVSASVAVAQQGNTVAAVANVSTTPSQLAIAVAQVNNTVTVSASIAVVTSLMAVAVAQASNTVRANTHNGVVQVGGALPPLHRAPVAQRRLRAATRRVASSTVRPLRS